MLSVPQLTSAACNARPVNGESLLEDIQLLPPQHLGVLGVARVTGEAWGCTGSRRRGGNGQERVDSRSEPEPWCLRHNHQLKPNPQAANFCFSVNGQTGRRWSGCHAAVTVLAVTWLVGVGWAGAQDFHPNARTSTPEVAMSHSCPSRMKYLQK